jgi:hypothetical protein
MKRNNLWIIGLMTAVITIIGLNVIAGRSNWANERSFFSNNWRHHYNYCDDYHRSNTERAKEFRNADPGTLNH